MKKYSRVFKYLVHYKGAILLYLLFTVLSVCFSIGAFSLLAPFFDIIFTTGKTADNPGMGSLRRFLMNQVSDFTPVGLLGLVCAMILVFIILKNLFLYLSYRVMNPLKNKIVNHLRFELYNKILHLPIGFFTERRKGDLISRSTNDLAEVENGVVNTLEGWIREPLTTLITLAALFYISPDLTITILICIPIIGFILGRISRLLRKDSGIIAVKQGESVSVLDETLNGLRVIKAFNAEGNLRMRYENINHDLQMAKTRIMNRRDLSSPLMEFLGVLVFCGILWFGGQRVLGQHILAPATFLAYLALFYNIIAPVKSLSYSFSNMQKGSAAIARIEEILNTKSTVDDNVNGLKIQSFNDKIEFKDVSFAYEDVVILDHINLVIPKGRTVALVGSSGAGKSTLADLVPRFHDVTSGELLIDGVNIKDYSLQSLRGLMSIVTQEPILFNDTIANNIRMGKQDAGMQEIEDAAKVANAHQFIMHKEAQYETNTGDRGNKLSGGERQRLTIARALVKNPPILILDEATSSLDTESERLVQDAINNMMQNRTSIVIAHRLSTIRHADEIIVLQKGKIVERGTHGQLMQQSGYYRKLVEMQEVR